MNLPNKLTLARVVMIPVFVYFLVFFPLETAGRWISLIVFIVACLTDLLDGKIARKYNLITNFGKFMDPLADKLLVCSALICLTGRTFTDESNCIPVVATIIIVAREFIISGFRLIAVEQDIVIAASMWGKWKTTFQMVMLIAYILPVKATGWAYLETILMVVATALTVISLVDYIAKNRHVMDDVTGKSKRVEEEYEIEADEYMLLGDEGAEEAPEAIEAAGDDAQPGVAYEYVIYDKLIELGGRVSCAESCTGGLVAAMLINVPGASEIFDEGYVTYSNESKHEMLGVPSETLETYGAVSEETAVAMAEGCARAAGCEFSIATTGIAGPSGGTPEKPVGLVYVSCCVRGNAYVRELRLSGDRTDIRLAATSEALGLLAEALSKI